ncbi:MAG: thermonuclease family protein [Pseudomonadota bacterium]
MTTRVRSAVTAVVASTLMSLGIAQSAENQFVISSPDVLDGQTLKDDAGHTYRLYAVRAPSLDMTCQDPDGQPYPCGEKARSVLEDYANGMLNCRRGGVDAEGIALVRCVDFANRDLASRLIRAGWALPDRAVSQDYVFEEIEAEARQSGMWNGTFTIR